MREPGDDDGDPAAKTQDEIDEDEREAEGGMTTIGEMRAEIERGKEGTRGRRRNRFASVIADSEGARR